MTRLTKDQVRKLPSEQQEAFADVKLQHIHSRRQLWERVSRGMSVTAGLLTGLAGGVSMLCIAFPRALPFAIMAVIGLVTFHANRLYRRLDAMTELLQEKSDDKNAS